jgi:hypothetical protein
MKRLVIKLLILQWIIFHTVAFSQKSKGIYGGINQTWWLNGYDNNAGIEVNVFPQWGFQGGYIFSSGFNTKNRQFQIRAGYTQSNVRFSGIAAIRFCGSPHGCDTFFSSYQTDLKLHQISVEPSVCFRLSKSEKIDFSISPYIFVRYLIDGIYKYSPDTVARLTDTNKYSGKNNMQSIALGTGINFDMYYKYGNSGTILVSAGASIALNNIELRQRDYNDNWRFPLGFLVHPDYFSSDIYAQRPVTRILNFTVTIAFLKDNKSLLSEIISNRDIFAPE